ncbi:unnamed protein product [Heligmosomoides polygyrus]|uniref:Sodium-and chloride-dependent glycine transporter 1 n=1 Tax=Heligmosomoides polygyrus TaxID=6339 RepID=A0A3P8FZ27_HELPZ|nr:unnamed protein product [Heligmosomoides polygyrus]
MDGSEWKAALRLQIEALARRNDLHRRCNRESIRSRTADMDTRIVRLRELVASDANYAAQFYLECVCHADETERILNRTSSRDKKRRKCPWGYSKDFCKGVVRASFSFCTFLQSAPIETILPERSAVANGEPRWWDQFSIHRKEDDYVDGHNEVRHLWKTQVTDLQAVFPSIACCQNLRVWSHISRHWSGLGIFFAPYLFCQVFIGFPMLYLHLCIGQYAGQTADVAFQRLMPITCGLGWAFVLAAIPVIIYHNIILTWSLQYLWYSALSVVISEPLPWENRVTAVVCAVEWRRDCSCFSLDILSLTSYTELTLTLPQRHIVLALVAAWLLVFAGVCRGTTWMSWAIRFTATIPYLLLLILLIRGLSLPGASLGLSFLFSSAFDSISSMKVQFSTAAEQVLFEIGVGAGALFSIAAYSRFRNNVYRDAYLLRNALTSVLASMVLFSFLGLLAISSGREISTIITHDPFYMVFTVVPSMTKLMRWGPLWMSILFASIVFTSVDAEFIWVEMLSSSVMNLLGSKNRQLNSRIIAIICFLGLLLEIPICSSGGFFLFHSMDSSSRILPLSETTVSVAGLNKFVSDVSSMLRVPMKSQTKWAHLRLHEKFLELFGPCGAFVRISWALICPCFLAVSSSRLQSILASYLEGFVGVGGTRNKSVLFEIHTTADVSSDCATTPPWGTHVLKAFSFLKQFLNPSGNPFWPHNKLKVQFKQTSFFSSNSSHELKTSVKRYIPQILR